MKKVFVTACAVVFAAVAAGAQGMGTVRDINNFGAEYMNRQSKAARQQTIKKEQKQVGNLEKAIAQANIKHNRQMFVLGSLGDAAQFAQYAPCAYTTGPQKPAAQKTAPAKPAADKKKETQAPAYYPYAGREGKVMALGDLVSERLRAKNKARKEAKAKAAKQEKKESVGMKEEKGSWLGALFGGRYPGESDEDYMLRIQMSTHPACQPFK